MSETPNPRPLLWVASSKRDFIEMPEEVVKDFGHWLFLVQKGKKPKNAKPLTGFGGAQVMELWKDHGNGTFRTVYTNLSRYSQNMLFESFSTSFRATSWPTYSSMSCEVALKSVKKFFKNQSFGISG